MDAAWDAINGTDKFASGKLPIRALAVMYPNHMHVVTVEGTGINKIEDLKGKRVSTGSPGSATEVYAIRVHRGGRPRPRQGHEDASASASPRASTRIKDKKIEAFFWVGGLPTAAVTDLAATPNTKIKMIDIAQFTEKMNAKYGPLYAEATIPKATYKGMDAGRQEQHGLEHHGGEREHVGRTRLQADQDHAGEARGPGPGAQGGAEHQAEWQTSNRAGIPWHPGALKYFKEKGIKVE